MASPGRRRFTPSAPITDATNVITLNNTGVADAAGNTGLGTTVSNNYAIDTVNPTVTVNIVDASLSDPDNSSQVTFTFSEAPGASFTAADITAVGGTVTGLAATADPLVYTATFTATDDFDGTGSVSVTAASYTDAAGNTGAAGSDTVAIDTAQPDGFGQHRGRLAQRRRQQLAGDVHVQRGAGRASRPPTFTAVGRHGDGPGRARRTRWSTRRPSRRTTTSTASARCR